MAASLPIPPNLAATVVRWAGDGGRAWLARLPRLVAEVTEAWDLEVGAPFEPGGNISWVAPARRRAGGLDAVLKVQLPDPESEPESAGLRAWAGEGAVRLFDHDTDRRALLLERCRSGRALAGEGGSLAAAAEGAALGRRLHQVLPPPGVPRLADVVGAWADALADGLDRQGELDPGLAGLAVKTLHDQPARSAVPVLLHGDLNPTNVLAAEREPWLTIDPKPLVGDPAYDGPRLVLQPDPLATADPAATVAERLAAVADGLGVERGLLARWCLVDAVRIGVFLWEHGDGRLASTRDDHVRLVLPHLG